MEGQTPDNYLTIVHAAEGLYKEKGSKFISLVFHVKEEDHGREILARVKKDYHDARHHCYAYRLGPEDDKYRSNDDGEPSGSAGKPILNQIYSYDLYYVMVIVVRYFGGTKLGVSGLINAYKTSARDAIGNARIIKKYIKESISLRFEYPMMNDVMRILKEEKPDIVKQDFDDRCVIHIDVKKNNVEKVISRLQKFRNVEINIL